MHFASYYRWLVYQHLFGPPRLPMTVLDIGSGDGGFIERIPTKLSVAIDISLNALQRVSAAARVCADGTQMPFRDAAFNHVILSDVIEHVEDDRALVDGATNGVKLNGTLWLSTTAADFTLFPPQITRRAEQSWGHVRKGYHPSTLLGLIGNDFECTLIEWPEVVFRHTYVLVWLCSKRLPWLAHLLTTMCFVLDKHLRNVQCRQGHIYIHAVRHNRNGESSAALS